MVFFLIKRDLCIQVKVVIGNYRFIPLNNSPFLVLSFAKNDPPISFQDMELTKVVDSALRYVSNDLCLCQLC